MEGEGRAVANTAEENSRKLSIGEFHELENKTAVVISLSVYLYSRRMKVIGEDMQYVAHTV